MWKCSSGSVPVGQARRRARELGTHGGFSMTGRAVSRWLISALVVAIQRVPCWLCTTLHPNVIIPFEVDFR
jgi:hypothetical protein